MIDHSISRLNLFLLLLFMGTAHFFVDTMLGVWPIYKSMAQLDMAKAGLIVAAGAFIGEGSQLFFGAYSDKGYRKIFIIGGLVLAMANTCLTYSSGYMGLFFLYLVTCIGSGSFHPCAASLVSGLIPARRSLLMTVFATGGSLGMATSQLTYNQAHVFFEGHTAFLIIPALLLVLILVFYPFPQVIQSVSHRPSLKDFADFFKNRPLRSLYFSQVANQSILWGTIFILPDALKTMGYSDWISYGGGHFFFIMGGACMMIPGGYLADLYSARHVMLIGGVLSCAIFYFIIFAGGISLAIILTALFLLGATLALMNPIAVSLGVKMEPDRSGAVSAFLMGLVWCVSEALGPGGVGVLSTIFDDYAPVKALAVLGTLFLAQIYGTVRLPKQIFHPIREVV